MKVTKAQAQENRARIVATAATLFRQHGYEGIGLADLMAASGFTHGGFYNHFRSKSDLIAEATARTLSDTATRTRGTDVAAFLDVYLTRQHRDARGEGCAMAALGGDAARQPESVKAAFAAGIEGLLAALGESSAESTTPHTRAQLIDIVAGAVGALVLSRACPDDSALADEILQVCRAQRLASPSPGEASKPLARRRRPAG